MAEAKNDRIKIYLVIVLSMILAASGYFRLIRPKMKGTARATSSAPVPIPPIPKEPEEKEPQGGSKRPSLFIEPISSIRDVFAEPAVPENVEKEKKEEEEKPKPPPTQLRGTIVGGEHPIAIINGRFLRIGDWIDDYQVMQIEKDQVRLNSGKNDIVLEVFKNARP
jgi:hypothetical protein